MFRGAGTLLNVATILLGSGLGVLLGHRLPQRTREVVTDGLGLVTLLIAATSAAAVLDPALLDAVGSSAPVLIVLASLLLGGIAGSLLRLEDRLERLGARLRRRLSPGRAGPRTRAEAIPQAIPQAIPVAATGDGRFVEGFVTASLVFCVGPLAVLGPLDDGLGLGIDKLALKATLDGFASIAFAASLGWGVAASVVAVAGVQGSLTVLAALLGGLLPEPHLLALTATGGLVLLGVGLRLLRVRAVPVADLLPALLVAPVLTQLVLVLR